MLKTDVFQKYSEEYDSWFSDNQQIYSSELKAVQELIPQGIKGIEIGVGTGRFALPLGIEVGVEPSHSMAAIAKKRGIHVIDGVAEKLPIEDEFFDYATMITTICFLNNVELAFKEAYRVTKKNGFLIVAFLDRETELGKVYEKHKTKSKFYKEATFYSTAEVTAHLKSASFSSFEYRQTVFSSENIRHQVKPGYGDGGFVVIKATK